MYRATFKVVFPLSKEYAGSYPDFSSKELNEFVDKGDKVPTAYIDVIPQIGSTVTLPKYGPVRITDVRYEFKEYETRPGFIGVAVEPFTLVVDEVYITAERILP